MPYMISTCQPTKPLQALMPLAGNKWLAKRGFYKPSQADMFCCFQELCRSVKYVWHFFWQIFKVRKLHKNIYSADR